MTVATDMTTMGEPSSARSRPSSPVSSRTAMIELREARNRWRDEAAAASLAEAAGCEPNVDDEPIEIDVLDLPSYDAFEATVIRDHTAWEDRRLKVHQLARRAEALRLQLEAERDDGPEGAIDLRDDAEASTDRFEHQVRATISPDALEGVVATIRKLSTLRDAGLLTTAEFDAKMADLLARV